MKYAMNVVILIYSYRYLWTHPSIAEDMRRLVKHIKVIVVPSALECGREIIKVGFAATNRY
jgi:hypothetical protein